MGKSAGCNELNIPVILFIQDLPVLLQDKRFTFPVDGTHRSVVDARRELYFTHSAQPIVDQ